MLPVTALTTYMFCPRKLYLGQVLGLKEEPSPAAALGILRHRAHDILAENEEALVTNLAVTTPEAILEAYRTAAHSAVHAALERSKGFLFKMQLRVDVAEARLTTVVTRLAEFRARQVTPFAEAGLKGRALWEAITPKLRPEFSVSSKKLGVRGKVDLVEVYPTTLRPVELKSGPVPHRGVWHEQRIQVAAYALLLEERFGTPVTRGAVRYLESGEQREVPVNPFLKQEVIQLLDRITKTLKTPAVPPQITNLKKCAACGLRDPCYRMAGYKGFQDALERLGAKPSTRASKA